MPDTAAPSTVSFAPRRFGHANIFVTELERSMRFYNRVCGVEEVRREPGIGAGFLTNGNTHHDFGIMQAGGGKRVGVGGHVQIPEGRGQKAGLNHMGWEMENEAVLVAAYRRAVQAGLKIHRTADHQLSHSVYVFDPDGHLHEFYADVIEDWRTVFNPDREDLITSQWEPLARTPMQTPYWQANPRIREVAGALFHTTRISRGVLVAGDYPAMKAFFTDIGGLRAAADTGLADISLLRGTATAEGCDLALFAARDGLEPGVHHFTLEVRDEAQLAEAERNAGGAGVEIELIIDRPHKRSLFVLDPDGLRVEFRCPRKGKGPALAGAAPGLRPYLV